MDPKKILIVKTSSLGDIIQAFPSLDYLRQKFPSAEIHWVVEKPFKDLVEAHPEINKVLQIDSKGWRKQGLFKKQTLNEIKDLSSVLKKENYDYIFDLQGNIKSSLILMMAKGKNKIGFGRKSVPEWPNLLFTNHKYNPPKNQNIRQDYLFLVQSYFTDTQFHSKETKLNISKEDERKLDVIFKPDLHIRPFVMICPGSAWTNKQLKEVTLIDFLNKIDKQLHGYFFLIWGNEEEKKLVQKIHSHFPQGSEIVEKLRLPLLQNVMSKMDLVISMDSLPLHLAHVAGTKTYSVFGASLGRKYAPLDEKQNAFYQGTCPYGRVFEKRCPILRTCPTGSCIKDIDSQDLFNHFHAWWQSQSAEK